MPKNIHYVCGGSVTAALKGLDNAAALLRKLKKGG